jgi:hypothetical protein
MKYQWVSQQYTRAVFMSFGLFVPSTNYFFVATFLVECFSTVRRPRATALPRIYRG